MIDSKKNLLSKEAAYRLSVLDTLLNRNVSDIYQNEISSDPITFYSDPDKHSRHVSPPSSQNLSENGVTNSTIGSPLFSETKTPTTRSQQLPILLARNYYTAPACLLRFVNTSSTIRSYVSKRRDSDGTVIDNQFDPIVDCNVDTNDEMDNFKSDEDGAEVFSIGTMTNRTSLMSDHQFHDSDDLAYIGVDPVDLNTVLQGVKSKYSPHFDKGCSPFFNMNETHIDAGTKVKEKVDIATSPLIIDESDKFNIITSTASFNSDEGMKPEQTELDSYPVDGPKNLNTTDVEADFYSPDFSLDKDTAGAPEYSTLKSGDFSVNKSELNGNTEQMPVYCRSLLYRIRVPLSKRLKNVDEDMLIRSMSSPVLSTSRVNLSCDRLYSTKSRMSNSVDSSSSFLRLSDLDSYSLESSRSDMNAVKHPSRSHDKKHKRQFSGLPSFEDRRKASKKYKSVNRK